MKKRKRRLKRWVIVTLLTLIATALFAGPILLWAYDVRGYVAIGGEWLVILGYMAVMYWMIQYSTETNVR